MHKKEEVSEQHLSVEYYRKPHIKINKNVSVLSWSKYSLSFCSLGRIHSWAQFRDCYKNLIKCLCNKLRVKVLKSKFMF